MQSSGGDIPFVISTGLFFWDMMRIREGDDARSKKSSRETITESATGGFLLQSASPGYDRGWDTEAFRLRELIQPQTVR